MGHIKSTNFLGRDERDARVQKQEAIDFVNMVYDNIDNVVSMVKIDIHKLEQFAVNDYRTKSIEEVLGKDSTIALLTSTLENAITKVIESNRRNKSHFFKAIIMYNAAYRKIKTKVFLVPMTVEHVSHIISEEAFEKFAKLVKELERKLSDDEININDLIFPSVRR